MVKKISSLPNQERQTKIDYVSVRIPDVQKASDDNLKITCLAQCKNILTLIKRELLKPPTK